jgi:hypothetical protein
MRETPAHVPIKGVTMQRQTVGERAVRVIGWWQQRGEPLVLSVLVGVALTLPLLWIAGLLTPQQVGGVWLGLLWGAGMLLLVRLPRLLRQERARMLLVAVLGGGALLGLLVAPSAHTLARPVPPAPVAPVAQQAAPLAQQESGGLTFKSPPRISREMFAQLLYQGTGGGGPSPAAPEADKLYDIIVGYELDPAVALAFFAQESQFCTTGICASHDMHSWGGQRAAFRPERSAGIVHSSLYGAFVSYANWEDGVHDWCELILYGYVGRGLDTVEAAIPVYAPEFDNNDPAVYINNVRRRVAVWRGQDPGPLFVDRHVYDTLEEGLVTETFLASDLEYHPSWAFHTFMLNEARAGRPLGSPLGESLRITADGKKYVVQTFALDTIYTPLADVESETDWSDVRRLSELFNAPPPVPETQPQPTALPTPTPAPPQPPALHSLR